MLSLTIPKIFFNIWFWLALVAVVIVIHYFWGKSPQPPRKSAFFEKHKRAITRTTDIFLILVILLGWVPLIYLTASMALEPFLNPPSVPIPLTGELKFTLAFFSIGATSISGASCTLIGCLSIFWTNLTKNKRLFLAVVSILPVGFTTLALLTVQFDEPKAIWSMVYLGLGSLASCWLINGSAIIAGQHFIRVSWLLMRKLKLVSGEFPG
jgi:hypothetical protein